MKLSTEGVVDPTEKEKDGGVGEGRGFLLGDMEYICKTGQERVILMNTTQEIAKLFNVADSTVRKWCISLEANGYRFFTEEKGKLTVRYFSKSDLFVFQFLQKTLNENKAFSLDQATQLCVERFGKGYGSEPLLEPQDNGLMPVVMQPFAHQLQMLQEENLVLKSELDAIRRELAESRREIGSTVEQKMTGLETKLDHFKVEIIEEITKSRAETHKKKKGFLARFFGG